MNKRIRNEAILLCAHMASCYPPRGAHSEGVNDVVDALGTSPDAVLVAFRAVSAVSRKVKHDSMFKTCSECGQDICWGSLYYAEAESLLRTGWEPDAG